MDGCEAERISAAWTTAENPRDETLTEGICDSSDFLAQFAVFEADQIPAADHIWRASVVDVSVR